LPYIPEINHEEYEEREDFHDYERDDLPEFAHHYRRQSFSIGSVFSVGGPAAPSA